MKPIGHIRSEFKEKFGIPKQPGLAPSLEATLVLEGEWAHETCWRGLDECSHLWVIFQFHASEVFEGGTVRPPLLGGEKRMGVFSTRSPHRPNPIGLSLVSRGSITQQGKETHIRVTGHDFLNGTPILDIKPYVSSYDQPTGAAKHWSDGHTAAVLPVRWEVKPPTRMFQQKVEEILRLDPRPRSSKATNFGILLENINVVFEIDAGAIVVRSLLQDDEKIK